MELGDVAKKLTGYEDSDFDDYEPPRVTERRQLSLTPGSRTRLSVRVAAGLFSTAGEVDREHKRLQRDPHRYIQARRKVARQRLGLPE